MRGIIDTATEFIAVESSDCTGCTSVGYTIEETTAVFDTNETIAYGAYEFFGSWAIDQYCVDPFTCLDAYIEFFLIQNVTEKPLNDAVSGILGHARPN